MKAPTLDLVNLDEPGLLKLYTECIEPILKSEEGDRLAAVVTYVQRRNWGILATIAVGAAAYWYSNDFINALIFGGVVFAAAHWYAYRPLQAVETATKRRALTTIAKAIGCTYELAGFEPEALPRFESLELLPSNDRATFQDCFSGNYQSCAFTFYDAHLQREVKDKNGSHWHTVFRGQVIRIAFPKKFLGVTVVRRDAGIFNVLERWTTKLQRVGLGDSRLEKAFEVYSNDQVEARYLIHPVFMERLLALETQFKGEKLRCAFEQGDLLVAVEGGDRFELGSMFSRLDDIARARSIISDIAQVMRLIDAALTAERSPLPTT